MENKLVTWAKDMGERAVKTFIQVFALQMIASGWFTVDGIVDISIPKRAAIAAGGALLSVVSSSISGLYGDHGTASVVDTPTE